MVSTSKVIYDKFNSSIKDNVLVCTKEELEQYSIYGLINNVKGEYRDRNSNTLQIDMVKPQSLNINLNNLINVCNDLSNKHKCTKIYCVSNKSYKKLKDSGYIIIKNNLEFFRMFDNELWLIYKVD